MGLAGRVLQEGNNNKLVIDQRLVTEIIYLTLEQTKEMSYKVFVQYIWRLKTIISVLIN